MKKTLITKTAFITIFFISLQISCMQENNNTLVIKENSTTKKMPSFSLPKELYFTFTPKEFYKTNTKNMSSCKELICQNQCIKNEKKFNFNGFHMYPDPHIKTTFISLKEAQRRFPHIEFNPSNSHVRMIPIIIDTNFTNLFFTIPHELLLTDKFNIKIVFKDGTIITHQDLSPYLSIHKNNLLRQIANKINNEEIKTLSDNDYLYDQLKYEQNNHYNNIDYKNTIIYDLQKQLEKLNKKHSDLNSEYQNNKKEYESTSQKQISNAWQWQCKCSDLDRNLSTLKNTLNDCKIIISNSVPKTELEQAQNKLSTTKQSLNTLKKECHTHTNNYKNEIRSLKSSNELLITTLLSSWLLFLLYLLRTHNLMEIIITSML